MAHSLFTVGNCYVGVGDSTVSPCWWAVRGLIDPELAKLITPDQQKRVLRQTYSRLDPVPRDLTLWWVLFCVGYWVAMNIMRSYLVPRTSAVQASFAIASLVFFLVISAYWVRHARAKAFFKAVRGHGYDVCPGCGYWLRDLTDAVLQCPECGAPRAPLRTGAAARPSE